jgi:hypothetical protein
MTAAVLVADDPVVAVEPVSDSLKSVACAMERASEALVDVASSTDSKAEAPLPATAGFISRCLYSTFYYTSYGVVFPTLFVANVVPGMGAVARGLADGATAAREAVYERKATRLARAAAARDPDKARVRQEGVETLDTA